MYLDHTNSVLNTIEIKLNVWTILINEKKWKLLPGAKTIFGRTKNNVYIQISQETKIKAVHQHFWHTYQHIYTYLGIKGSITSDKLMQVYCGMDCHIFISTKIYLLIVFYQFCWSKPKPFLMKTTLKFSDIDSILPFLYRSFFLWFYQAL